MTTPPSDMPSPDVEESMGIDPFERNWMIFSVGLLVVFFALVTIAGFALGFQVPGPETRVDPQTVTQTAPFSEPGLRQVAEGEYEAYVVARAFSYDPSQIEVPVGSKVTIYVTSPDIQHGFKIQDTNVNMMIVPGQVSKLTYTFDRVGEFPYICTEYCGLGHAAMFGTVRVVQPGEEGGQ
jgi:cytochrome c oxidase subunit 2